ncbi:thermonuclease family protein [Pseudomonas sp. RIT-PI-AD]|uniref:thermonuclease family protein n=1 Tax=Pseudomonas sp. RIT-PI-AD TaxID=3035294 RepID=UPI0021D83D72|nr:thermonuclease family protein [Pseudomonas sp. RIT-PI-AD]
MAFLARLKKASLVGAFFVSLAGVCAARAQCPLEPGLRTLEVKQVVDGDTLRLADGRSVRLIGVNAPEIGRHGHASQPFAEAARRRLAELVAASHGRVGLRLGEQPKDRYGRTLAHVYDQTGQNLEARLLEEGFGYRVAIAPNTRLLACQREAEASARRGARGLWRDPPLLSPQRIVESGFALVQGRVARAQRNRGGLWLELDGPLVVRVESALLKGFSRRFPQSLAGRRVEVRGWVIDRSRRGDVPSGQARWMLPLSHPDMIEVLP